MYWKLYLFSSFFVRMFNEFGLYFVFINGCLG